MKTEESTALVPRPTGALAIIGTQLRLKKKILNAHRLATTADEFHVPRDGSLYDAVERVRPGGTIRIAAGEYRIDRVMHINKPLSIVGEGKECTVLVSNLEEHYLNVRHDGYFAVSHITFKSEDRLHCGMLVVECDEVLIEQNDFAGLYHDVVFKGRNKRNKSQACALLLYGNTSGNIKNNLFIYNIVGLFLRDTSCAEVSKNKIESQADSGVRIDGLSNCTLCENTISHNKASGIHVNGDAVPILRNNLCEMNESFNILYSDKASGTAEENLCRGIYPYKNSWEFISCCGIKIQDKAKPYLLRNTCEANAIGIAYGGSASGTAVENVCKNNNSIGILLTNKVKLSLINNTCYGNSNGISYADSATGTAEENVCNSNTSSGIQVYTSADPTLVRNVCEENSYNGISYDNNASGLAKENRCSKNKTNGIMVSGNAKPTLENNMCEANAENGIKFSNVWFGYNLHGHLVHLKNICAGIFNFTGFAVGNSCISNKRHGIYICMSTPKLNNNTCDKNGGAGIFYSAIFKSKLPSSGVAEDNICMKNRLSGILISDGAMPTLRRNTCIENWKSGLSYHGNSSGFAENNIFRGNILRGITVRKEANPNLLNNIEE